jgi:hypothetical protein
MRAPVPSARPETAPTPKLSPRVAEQSLPNDDDDDDDDEDDVVTDLTVCAAVPMDMVSSSDVDDDKAMSDDNTVMTDDNQLMEDGFKDLSSFVANMSNPELATKLGLQFLPE